MRLWRGFGLAVVLGLAACAWAQETGVSHPESAVDQTAPTAQSAAQDQTAPAAPAADANAKSQSAEAPPETAQPLLEVTPKSAAVATAAEQATPTAPATDASPKSESAGATEAAEDKGFYRRPLTEPAIERFGRRDAQTLAMKLGAEKGAAEVLLHDFTFEGKPVETEKLHLKQLADGVYEVTSLAWTVGEWEMKVHDRGGYYGLGERFNTLNHAHEVVHNLSQDNVGAKGSSTYKPVPFFMSLKGYGLWVDTTSDATFDLNASDTDEAVIRWSAERMRVVVIAGPKFPVILDRFTAQTGRQQLPPYWALAPWISRDYHMNDAEVMADVDKARTLGLPASVVLIDSPWATNYNTYEFNPKQFADAGGMVKHIHAEGYKLVLWHTAWINSKTDVPKEKGFADRIPTTAAANYAEAAQAGYFVKAADGSPWVGRWWKGAGSLVDFTNPAAKQWWQDQVRKAIAAGADGFKDDDGEGNFLGGAHFSDETDPRLMRNRYAVLYNQAVEELIQHDLKGNGVLLQRSATVGSMNQPLLWGGDNEASFSAENGLPTVVTAGLNAGMSGMALWLADLGGYLKKGHTADEAQVFERWTEFSAFSPAMETISTENMLPWDYGDAALANYKRYAVLHMSLFPYRYAAAEEAARDGMPLMRALALVYQDDKQAREAADEYLLGPDLLVAPVTNALTQRAVYLPAGQWVNYWSGAAEEGGKSVLLNVPVEAVPVYARAGAVIAKLPEDVMTLVPFSESGNNTVPSMDDRRVYEVMGGPVDEKAAVQTDFEGRKLTRGEGSLKIEDGVNTLVTPAKVTVRWRFGTVTAATVDGATVELKTGADGPYVEFSHTGTNLVEWK